MNIRDVLWHLSNHGSELEKKWTLQFEQENGVHKNKTLNKCKYTLATAGCDRAIELLTVTEADDMPFP